ncbi:hypothetical protein Tco_0311686 [Tanacetum coccineum]
MSPPEWCHVACQPSPEPPPVNGGQWQRSTVVNDGQPWRTTGQPLPDHRSTAVDRQSTVGSNGGHRCHVTANRRIPPYAAINFNTTMAPPHHRHHHLLTMDHHSRHATTSAAATPSDTTPPLTPTDNHHHATATTTFSLLISELG